MHLLENEFITFCPKKRVCHDYAFSFSFLCLSTQFPKFKVVVAYIQYFGFSNNRNQHEPDLRRSGWRVFSSMSKDEYVSHIKSTQGCHHIWQTGCSRCVTCSGIIVGVE